MTLSRRRVWGFCLFLSLAVLVPQSWAQRPKNITGVVTDRQGTPIPDALVFVRDTEAGVVRTHSVDDRGIYAVNGLPADVDYEVYAQFEDARSETKLISRLLDRVDHVLNFALEVVLTPPENASTDGAGLTLETFDRVQLHASFDIPEGFTAPIPAALLLHGFGETRSVWNTLRARLLVEGWAVMTLDLRGHGQSRLRNAQAIDADPSWRTDPAQFPLDLEPALDWLKTQPRLASDRITVIGTDVGANLALLANSRFPEVHSAVAINPNLDEALRLAGTAREFEPRMAHLIVADRQQGQAIRPFISGASRISLIEVSGGTTDWLAAPTTVDEIIRWLHDTY